MSNKFKPRDTTIHKYRPFSVNQSIYHGAGSRSEIAKICEYNGWKKIFIVADPGLVQAGLIKQFETLLDNIGVDHVLFSDVRPDPPVEKIEIAIKQCHEFKPDALLAIGGGSSMDTAKGVAIVGESDHKVEEFWQIDADMTFEHRTYPMIAVPTTAGTGSEVTRNAVISDRKNYKLVIIQNAILPKYAILDPDMLATLPKKVAAASSVDALVHAVEAYVSLRATDFSDAMAERAMALIGPTIRAFIANRANAEAASRMILGSAYAGIALSLANPGQAHCLSHPLTKMYHLSHGDANAIVFPAVVEYNALSDMGKFKKIYNLICPEKAVEKGFEAKMLVNELIQLNKDLGIDKSLSELGVTQEGIKEMVEECFVTPMYINFPHTANREEMNKLYQRAFIGYKNG